MTLTKFQNPALYPTSFSWMLDRLFNELEAAPEVTSFKPRVDVVEEKDSYLIHVTAPGMKKEDFKIEVQDRKLVISGERKFEKSEGDGRKYHVLESQYGVFSRVFRLPDNLKKESIAASYVDGILTVTLPKDEARALVNQIAVN